MASETGRMSVAIPADMQKKLDTIAASEERSRNWVVNQAINQYLDIHDWQTMRIRERLKISENQNTEFHSGKDVDQMIETFKS